MSDWKDSVKVCLVRITNLVSIALRTLLKEREGPEDTFHHHDPRKEWIFIAHCLASRTPGNGTRGVFTEGGGGYGGLGSMEGRLGSSIVWGIRHGMEKDRRGHAVDEPQCLGYGPLIQSHPECEATLRQEFWRVDPQALKGHPTKVTNIDTFRARQVTATKEQIVRQWRGAESTHSPMGASFDSVP